LRKNILYIGIGIFIIGLIIWFAGNFGYLDLFGRDPYNYNGLTFWSIFGTIGFILFIAGIICSIIGFVTITVKTDRGKNIETPTGRCPFCGRVIPNDAMVCPFCGKNFSKNL
jgi:vacuolar-type H+-ATPase subunit I/STV1